MSAMPITEPGLRASQSKLNKPGRKHRGDAFNQYPEVPNRNWTQPIIDEQGNQFENPHRRPLDLPKDWHGVDPRSWRTELPLALSPLPKEATMMIANRAHSREHFHDYNKINSKPMYGLCLCELTILSGNACERYLKKGEDGFTPVAGCKHWAWQINVAPRGYLCPLAYQRYKDAAASDPLKEGCNILIKEPDDDWALEQEVGDVIGTVAGRVSSDKYMEGFCPRCQNRNIGLNSELLEAQIMKFKPENGYTISYLSPDEDEEWPANLLVFPLEYRPSRRPAIEHAILTPGNYYHVQTYFDLKVPWDEVWHPELDITYKHFLDTLYDQVKDTPIDENLHIEDARQLVKRHRRRDRLFLLIRQASLLI